MMFTALSLFEQTALALLATEANSLFLFYNLYSRSHFQEIPAFAGRTIWMLEVRPCRLEVLFFWFDLGSRCFLALYCSSCSSLLCLACLSSSLHCPPSRRQGSLEDFSSAVTHDVHSLIVIQVNSHGAPCC
jgi:hypothetical protein